MTQEDKQLLELAARAAGYDYLPANGVIVVGGIPGNWNPLTNDGDAFRLAAKLQLEIDICKTGIAVRTPCGRKILIDSESEKDVYSACRLCITRAAAEIGRDMQ